MTEKPANHWAPAIAADSKGNVTWPGTATRTAITTSSCGDSTAASRSRSFPSPHCEAYETRASLAVDRQDRVWIAYELGGPNWGKDFGRVVPKSAPPATEATARRAADGVGIPLYNPAGGGEVLCRRAAATAGRRSGRGLGRVAAAQEFRPAGGRPPTGGCGSCSAIIRCPAAARETWAEYAMSYDGKAWSKPRMLADSDDMLDNRPAVVPFGADGVMAVYQQRLAAAGREQHGRRAAACR